MPRLSSCSFVLLLSLEFGSSAAADVLFVKPTPTGAGDCGSWADACTLPDALNRAATGDEVWVMAGTYGPIYLKDGAKIIGGFDGHETSASQSNPAINVTVLDGGGSDTVVIGMNNPPPTLLRGFHIHNGYAGKSGGGGLMLSGSSAMIVQCVFENNTASTLGGAVAIWGPSSPQFTNCIFRHNGARAMENLPFDGGAVFLESGEPGFTNCLFYDNKAGRGGAFAKYTDGIAMFTNCTFANNQATWWRGGAVSDPSESVHLWNCILWGNTRLEGDPPMPTLDQIYGLGNGPDVRYSDVQGGWRGTGNIDENPLFQDVAGDKFNLQVGSPCQDTGSNAFLPLDVADLDWDGNTIEALPFDLALRPRTLGIAVDMGAYEIPICGDGICDADENSCNCPQDCGPAPMNEEPGSSCHDGIDNDCDGLVDCDDSDCGLDPACMGIVPTVSEWGLVILGLLLLTGAKIYFGHQPGRVPAR